MRGGVVPYRAPSPLPKGGFELGPQVEFLLDYLPADFRADGFLWSVVHEQDRVRLRAELDCREPGLPGWRSEFRLVARDGRVVWIRDVADHVDTGKDGSPRLIWCGVWTDVTEQKRLAEELAEFRAKYLALVEQIPAVLYVNLPDDEDTTTYVSPQTNPILGIPETAWLTGDWDKYIHPDDRQRVIDSYEEFLRSASEGVDEYRFQRPDGQMIWIHDRVRVIRDEDGMPQLVQGVMFDVTQQKEAEAIVRRQAELLEKADAIGREFTELVLRGSDRKQVLDVLAGIVDNPVVLEDAAHQLVDYAAHGVSLQGVLSAWAAHSRTGHDDEQMGVARVAGAEPKCTWISVSLREEEWGRIHVLEMATVSDPMDGLALDRAAAAIGISLLSERDAANLADNARAALLSDIWRGRFTTAQEVIARARGFGAEFEGRTLIAVVVEAEGPQGIEALSSGEGERQQIRIGVLAAFRQALAAASSTGLSALVGDRVLGVVGIPAETDGKQLVLEMGEDAVSRIGSAFPELLITVGLSGSAEPGTLRKALTEASEAAAYGAWTASGSSVHHYDDLGVRQLLARFGEGPELSRFVEAELGPLMQHDSGNGAPLLETVRVYLESGADKAKAARVLHLERRSMYYRLDKIESLLGKDLSSHDSKLRLGLALHCLDLLQQRASRNPQTA